MFVTGRDVVVDDIGSDVACVCIVSDCGDVGTSRNDVGVDSISDGVIVNTKTDFEGRMLHLCLLET